MTCIQGIGNHAAKIRKVPTGIRGFDEITGGGMPMGRTALIAGSPGTGKTMFALEFLVRGAGQYNEPGVFISFEETVEELIQNGASLGFDIPGLSGRNLLLVDYIRVERSEIEETGEYDLDGLFIRLEHAIDSIGAKRVVLDTVETLFGGLPNHGILRAELRRLFRWLKDKGMTTVITAERGRETLTREGLEEYVSDCVLLLDHRINEQISTRRLRVVKYRGSSHGTNEYPFLMGDTGFMVLPITTAGLAYHVSTERIPSGIQRLDSMLDGKGYYRGSMVLVTGTAGTGKTSVGATFADAACRRGERAVYFAFEESPDQIMRNMSSIGMDLERWVHAGLLTFVSERPTSFGMEHHLLKMINAVDTFDPEVVIIDPFSNLPDIGSAKEVKAMIQRLTDHLKARGVTTLMTALTSGQAEIEATEVGISSLADTWILLKAMEVGGERNRGIYILKSRGMAHSNQVREYSFTPSGIEVSDVYVGSEGVLTGSARLIQEAKERDQEEAIRREIERIKNNMEKKRSIMEAHIERIMSEFEFERNELAGRIDQNEILLKSLAKNRIDMAASRMADEDGGLIEETIRNATQLPG